ncbi:hypothetical protein [Flavivirga rizhaonensis]|uniref:Uncharacterized protein n=1 Tax=Flavivirga rizhaonensis TaxID=2559571 RepID=A0A4S1DYI2_9FLAO|nr:hypothetical protein [Flavivirga rizhaonensis]TGV03361.1 hypothetical protein EM932_06720 [Flavivirga rizhaonensis]
MEKISKTILYFCFVILITGCSKDDDKANEDTPVADVYVTGTDDNKAVYWKNGKKTILSDTNSSATSIFVTDNDDVYVAGSEGDNAVYWKNGAKTILDTNNAVINDIWVSQNDIVHAVGKRDDLNSSINKSEAVYWKNDQENLLYQGEKAVNILVKNETVYIVGYFKNGEVGYWKDGVQVILPENNVIIVDCHSIHLNNNNLYIAANIITQESAPNMIGAYWLNNNLEELPEIENNSSSVTDITIVDEKLFATGFEKDKDNKSKAVYWMGDAKVILSNTSSRTSGIFAMDNDIYISGYDENEQGIIQACYWKNMEQIFLPTDGLYTYPIDIFVKTSN